MPGRASQDRVTQDRVTQDEMRTCHICGCRFVVSNPASKICDACTASKSSHDSNQPLVPKKTKWQSPPFSVRFAEAYSPEEPQPPPPKPRSQLFTVLRSRSFLAAATVLVVGGVLISRYGVPRFLRPRPQKSLAVPPAAVGQAGI